jgi:hypothetical protein
MRSRSWMLAVASVLVVFALGVLVRYVPHLTQDHPVSVSTPSPEGLVSVQEVKVRPGQRACIAPVPLEPAIRRVRMVLHALGTNASALDIELRGPGYRGTGRFAGYTPGARVPAVADVSPAPTTTADGTLCLRNTGRRSVGLVGTDEGFSASLPGTVVDGKSAGAVDPALAFLDGPPRSLLSQAGTVLGRASDFTGGVVPLWLLWPLTVLLVFAVPVAVALGFASTVRRDSA